jgi:hypothetical protein
MEAIAELLDWLAVGGALSSEDTARYHEALALKLDWLRHIDRELAVKDAALRFVADELEAHESGETQWWHDGEVMSGLIARLRKAIDGEEL